MTDESTVPAEPGGGDAPDGRPTGAAPALPGAMMTALVLVDLAAGTRHGDTEAGVAEEVDAVTGRWDLDELTEAFAVLITAAASLVAPGSADADRVTTVLPAVVTRLAELRLAAVGAADLPVVAGVVTAALFGQHPFAWHPGLARDQQLPGDGRRRLLVWCYTTWILSELVDAAELQRAGGFTHLLTTHLLAE